MGVFGDDREVGLPDSAALRLQELLGSDGLFTSSLGAGEFALLGELGSVPLGQVLGACVHQVGWQYLPAQSQWGGDEVICTLDTVAGAWDEARQLAFSRLSQEASKLGADLVVAVNLQRGAHDWARRTVDYVVRGTAIRVGGGGHPDGLPVLSDLSGQEYWKLVRRGSAPAGLVASTAVVFVSQSVGVALRRRLSTMRNQELTGFSRGFAAARDIARRQLRHQARDLGAAGVIGVQLDYSLETGHIRVATKPQRTGLSPTSIAMGGEIPMRGKDRRHGLVITVQAVGTAIRRPVSPAGQPTRTGLRLRATA